MQELKYEELLKENKRLEREVRVLTNRNEMLKSSARSQMSLSNAMEREKRRQEAYVDLLLHHCPDIIFMLDEDLKFLLGTHSVSQIIDVTDVSVLHGMKLFAILEQYEPKAFTLGFLREISMAKKNRGSEIRPSFEIAVENGVYNIDVLPFNALNGDFAGVLIIMHDIADLVMSKSLAEQANRAKSEFLSRMSHEMRTPMNAVIGMTRIALQSQDLERKNYCLAKIQDASAHLLEIVNDILDLSKIEANKFDIYKQPMDLRQTVEKITGVLGVRMEEKSQNFACVIDNIIPQTIIGDELRFTQVISNLLTNANKFTPVGGDVSLNIKLKNTKGGDLMLWVEVQDSGIGISQEQQVRMFSAFEQLDGGTTRQYGGSGLGLSICKKIIDLMGGQIWIESELGHGAKFIFTIPINSSNVEIIEEETVELVIPDLSGHKILVAEDIEINREIVEAIISETGATVVFAENGLDAVSAFQQDLCGYSLIFMDIQMPVMDGFEATRTIRSMAEQRAKDIPIVAMTANVFRDDVERCIAAGANAHLGKPLDTDELFKVLTEYCLEN